MAKPRPVTGLDPDRRLRPNARRILAVRIDEVYSYDGLMADPANVTELHDMRIACKRLRYLLEIFAIAFEDDLEPFIDEVKGLQDLLGDIHDCDVQIPMLEDHLAWLDGARGRRGPPAGGHGGAARSPAGARPGPRGRLPGVRAPARHRAAAATSAWASTRSSAAAAGSATSSTPGSSTSGAG